MTERDPKQSHKAMFRVTFLTYRTDFREKARNYKTTQPLRPERMVWKLSASFYNRNGADSFV